MVWGIFLMLLQAISELFKDILRCAASTWGEGDRRVAASDDPA
jgi:hypothetical protein